MTNLKLTLFNPNHSESAVINGYNFHRTGTGYLEGVINSDDEALFAPNMVISKVSYHDRELVSTAADTGGIVIDADATPVTVDAADAEDEEQEPHPVFATPPEERHWGEE